MARRPDSAAHRTAHGRGRIHAAAPSPIGTWHWSRPLPRWTT